MILLIIEILWNFYCFYARFWDVFVLMVTDSRKGTSSFIIWIVYSNGIGNECDCPCILRRIYIFFGTKDTDGTSLIFSSTKPLLIERLGKVYIKFLRNYKMMKISSTNVMFKCFFVPEMLHLFLFRKITPIMTMTTTIMISPTVTPIGTAIVFWGTIESEKPAADRYGRHIWTF